jgi:hypothetical protein
MAVGCHFCKQPNPIYPLYCYLDGAGGWTKLKEGRVMKLTRNDKQYLTRLLNNINSSITGEIYRLKTNKSGSMPTSEKNEIIEKKNKNIKKRMELIDRINY